MTKSPVTNAERVYHASKQIKTTQGSILRENGKDESFVNNFHWAGDLKRGGIPYPITVYIIETMYLP